MTAAEQDKPRGVRLADVELDKARKYAARSHRELYRRMAADLKQARRDGERAAARAKSAERRAERAERKFAELRASRTWRAGRAVLWLPTAVRRAVRRKGR
ncbi:MAG: hypothetical protein ACRDQ7_02135 [Haloechinothrix sp.]